MADKMTELDQLIAKYMETYPDDFYERLLLGPLTAVYTARKETGYSEWMNYGNLLVDKFAIHSSSFYHLSQGIVERKTDGGLKKGKGYDLFTVNALFRVMIETYVAFNWIFIAPKTIEEKEFRFLLWKLDGLFEKRKLEYTGEVKPEVVEALARDAVDKVTTITSLKHNAFYQSLSQTEIDRVFDVTKNKAIWKYELQPGGKLRPLKIIEIVQMTCRTDEFLNIYRYTSLYSHSNHVSVEHFNQIRGKPVPDGFAEPMIKLAVFLTTLVIDDMCLSDQNAARAFGEQELYFQRFISSTSRQIKKIPVRPVK